MVEAGFHLEGVYLDFHDKDVESHDLFGEHFRVRSLNIKRSIHESQSIVIRKKTLLKRSDITYVKNAYRHLRYLEI